MVASLAGHTHALEDTRGIGASANRTGSTQTVVLAVSHITDTAKTVSRNNALETLTFRGSDNVYKFAFLEDFHCQYFTIFLLVALLKAAELGEIAFGSGVGLCKMAFQRLGDTAFFLITKSQLNSLITIFLDGSNLCDDTRTSFNNCARNLLSVGIKKTGHSNFFTN